MIVLPDIACIVKIAGSPQASFGGAPVGEANGDGAFNSIPDAEIASCLNLPDAISVDPAGAVAST